MPAAEEPSSPPHRLSWEPGFSVGQALLDTQHQQLLSQCNVLADLCTTENSPGRELKFDLAFAQLRTMARTHFETEAALLDRYDPEQAEDHRIEVEEFDYVADEIATTDNFDRLELQRFVSLWFMGHIAGSASQIRAVLAAEGGPSSAVP